ncbi:imm11 family protein [Vibrio coralliilyticus]|uniref:imm11 family protein n=1 Tax=Vibrio coralliilyticus TaxID=190893 RepID=UPI002FD19EE4
MYLSLISENYFTSNVNFNPVDNREYLYSTNTYNPTSAVKGIVWQEQENGSVKDVGPIIDCGDLSVNKLFAEKLMSFDPYGVEFYPSKLKLDDGEIEDRHLIAINNVIDVLDESKSDIEISPRSGKKIIHTLYISENKLKRIPKERRVAFSVKGVETAIFFSEELFDVINSIPQLDLLKKVKFSTDDIAPKF